MIAGLTVRVCVRVFITNSVRLARGVEGFVLSSDEQDCFEMSWTERRGGTSKVFIYTRSSDAQPP